MSLTTAVRGAVAAVLVLLIPAPAAAVPAAERQILLELYRSTNGRGWIDGTNWNDEPGTECGWFGIKCGGGDHVQGIVLDRNGLSGRLPAGLNQLTSLISFSVIGNALTGPVPSLRGLNDLRYFDVSQNELTGPLPDLRGLAHLSSFDASNNQLSGPLPPLTGLAALEFFEAGHNQLTGSIPRLESLTSLKMLDLRSNRLSGPLPPPPPRGVEAWLCPNRLDHPSADASLDSAWNKLTRDGPWWKACGP